jgi:hypothetical protein
MLTPTVNLLKATATLSTKKLLKDEKGDLLADSHNILNMRNNYFPQLLNMQRVNYVGRIEMNTNEPADSSTFRG